MKIIKARKQAAPKSRAIHCKPQQHLVRQAKTHPASLLSGCFWRVRNSRNFERLSTNKSSLRPCIEVTWGRQQFGEEVRGMCTQVFGRCLMCNNKYLNDHKSNCTTANTIDNCRWPGLLAERSRFFRCFEETRSGSNCSLVTSWNPTPLACFSRNRKRTLETKQLLKAQTGLESWKWEQNVHLRRWAGGLGGWPWN